MKVWMKLADLLALYNKIHIRGYSAFQTAPAKTIVKDALTTGEIVPDGKGYYKLTSQKLEEAKRVWLERRE